MVAAIDGRDRHQATLNRRGAPSNRSASFVVGAMLSVAPISCDTTVSQCVIYLRCSSIDRACRPDGRAERLLDIASSTGILPNRCQCWTSRRDSPLIEIGMHRTLRLLYS